MKHFEEPVIEVIDLSVEDVITTSVDGEEDLPNLDVENIGNCM